MNQNDYDCKVCKDTYENGSYTCPACCPHYEHEHFVCNDCGTELDPGEAIDRATDSLEDR